MAEEKTTGNKTDPANKGLRPLIMLVGVVVAASAAGVGTAKFLGGGPDGASAETIENPLDQYRGQDTGDGTYEYIDFEPITTNLDEQRMSRHIQVTPSLAISAKPKELVELAMKDVEAKKDELANWLTVYFNGCTLDNVRGSDNVNRIQREIRDEFNDRLWPDKKPLIHHVLFKDYKIQ